MSPTRRRRRATAAWEGRPTIRVATLPGRGLYARHLGHPEGIDGVHHVTVGQAGVPRAPSCLDHAWLAEHLAEVDVVHAIAAPSGLSGEELAGVVEVVRDSGTPLVFTAYHLEDPHALSSERYAEQLDVLVPTADAVVTLTASAAAEIADRWGVEATVLPHPHAVDFVRMRQQRPRFGARFKVGVHLGNLRTAVEPAALLLALADAVSSVEGGYLVATVNESAADRGSAAYDPALLHTLEEAVRGIGVVHVSRPLSEPSLWDYLFALDVCVLPGLRGSHSIWPEACYDLGTQIVLPGGTHAAAQQESQGFDLLDGGRVPDPASVVSAVKEASSIHRTDGAERADPIQRWQQRVDLAECLRSTYARLTGLERR
jgi:hypothetical protein